MKRNRQLQFLDPRLRSPKFFGGSLTTTRSHRTARPISTKHPMHFVLRSSQARGEKSFLALKNRGRIKAHLVRSSQKFGVKIINAANVGNHIHLVLKLSHRRTYQPFIAALTGGIARIVLGARKPQTGKFWDYRPFSRIVEGLRAFQALRDYILINRLQGAGISRHQAERLVRGKSYQGSLGP